MLSQFHDKIEVRVNLADTWLDAISVENDIKQNYIPASTLLAQYFVSLLKTAGKLFNLKRLCAKTNVLHPGIIELLYADDSDLLERSQEYMQLTMNAIDFCSRQSIGVYSQLASSEALRVTFYNCESSKAGGFKGIIVNTVGLDDKISYRIIKVSSAFDRLEKFLRSRHSISFQSRIRPYNICTLSYLLYRRETWVVYRKHLRN